MKTKKWIDALRSGQYEQCQGQLKCRDRHCCLGVLAEVHGKVSWTDTDHDLDEDILPTSIQYELIDMNDGGYSFRDIAEYIERYAPENLEDWK